MFTHHFLGCSQFIKSFVCSMIHPILLFTDQKETGQKYFHWWFIYFFFLFSIFFSPLEWRILSPCCMQIWSCFSSRVSHDNPHQFGYPRSGFYVFFFSNFTYEIFDHSFPETLFLCYETMIFFPFTISSFHRCQAFKEKVCCNQTHKEFSSSFNKA